MESMKRGRWADNPEVLRQRSRHGVVRAADIEAEGMNSRTIYRRCLPGGPWRRLLPGIIALQNSEPMPDQRVAAALLYAGPDAVITGTEACRRYGLRPGALPPGQGVHVLVLHERKLLSSEFVTVERTRCMPQPVYRGNVPLAPLVRAVTDTARRIREVDPVRKLLVEAIQNGGRSPQELLHELDRGSQRGTAIPRRQIAEICDVRSMAELAAKELCNKLTIQPTHRNIRVYGSDGRYVGCPDAWWDDVAVAWEIDSVEFHYSKDGYARTLERNARYAAAGILVVQTLPRRLRDDSPEVLAEVEATLRAAADRPRPPVQIMP